MLLTFSAIQPCAARLGRKVRQQKHFRRQTKPPSSQIRIPFRGGAGLTKPPSLLCGWDSRNIPRMCRPGKQLVLCTSGAPPKEGRNFPQSGPKCAENWLHGFVDSYSSFWYSIISLISQSRSLHSVSRLSQATPSPFLSFWIVDSDRIFSLRSV